ncbi:MAG: fucose pyrophosphorylase domain-containing protein [Anaerolineae bacterium]
MGDEAAARAAFLEQANRNNWQVYLSSLRGGAPGWDRCILTASDERQADMYRRQLAWRRDADLLPRGTSFSVVADPGGRRIGSGGATLRVLATPANGESNGASPAQRTLIIHSGGDSKRLPHCSATGKLFARVPRALPDGRASTIFDEFLISLSGLAAAVPHGVLIASGDVLVIFDHLQLALLRSGVSGVSAAAPVETGRHHGVYVTEDGTQRVRAYLHKPSSEELAQWRGVDADGMVQIDTGLVWLDADTGQRLAQLARQPKVWALCEPNAGRHGGSNPLNLYGDLLLPLPQSTTYERYLEDSSDGPATEPIRRARRVIWQHLRGTTFSVESLRPAEFIHFGTSREYWGLVTASPDLARVCGWEAEVASARPPVAPGQATPWLISAVVETVLGDAGAALIVDSHLAAPHTCGGATLLAGVRASQPLDLPADLVVHQLPVHGGFVTRVFGLDDDPKLVWDSAKGTFLARGWQCWLGDRGLAPEVIWPDVAAAERTLWNARLYPVAESREESLALSLPLCRSELAMAEWREHWRDALRLSLAESFALADGARLLADVAEIEDFAAAKRFLALIVDEVPCAEARATLGATSDALSRRSQLVATWLADAADVLKLRGYRALAEVTGSYVWEDRGFRTLAHMVAGSTASRQAGARRPFAGSAARASVRVAAAARLDFGGGWTDTPPHSIERGGTVANAAVVLNGDYPITVEGAWLDEPRLILDSRDIDSSYEPRLARDVLAYANPADPFALLKAALVLSGVVPAAADPQMPVASLLGPAGRGLRLSTRTDIPRGSGLGTSSIMAGAVLACLGQLLGAEPDQDALFENVLCLEQMLTTGGGWQDQVGGLTGGIKLITSAPGLPQRLVVRPLQLCPSVQGELAERLVLVYTGQQRLAKNLLRAVMGRWMARDREMVWLLGEIARLALQMRDALEQGDVSGFGRLLSEHWGLNKRMDPGCSNPFIDRLFETMAPYIDGGKLAGAGGGGFAMVIARDSGAAGDLRRALGERYPGTSVRAWPCAIAKDGWVADASR